MLTVGVFQEALKEFGANIEAKIDSKIYGPRVEMQHGFNEVRKEFVKVRTETQKEFKSVRTEMARCFDGVREEVDQKIGGLRSEMARGFDKVRDDIIDVIDQNIQPQITSAVSRITRLERKAA